MSTPSAVRVGRAVFAGGSGIGLENVGTGHALHDTLGNAFPAGADADFLLRSIDVTLNQMDSGFIRMISGEGVGTIEFVGGGGLHGGDVESL